INLSKYKYDVIWTSILSLPIALSLTAIIQHNLLNRLGKKLCVTQKFGNIDVWNYITDNPEVIWVIVRDINNDLMYYGYIEAYSDTSSNIEVFLRNVSVYKNLSGVKLYDTDGLYIQRDRENLIIEFPKTQ
ncbi:hypothetical protein IID62_00765, partial [candidate division KSB1 bacterium]|nr:hypothetical protein [candidate division KSB1 bacterium]